MPPGSSVLIGENSLQPSLCSQICKSKRYLPRQKKELVSFSMSVTRKKTLVNDFTCKEVPKACSCWTVNSPVRNFYCVKNAESKTDQRKENGHTEEYYDHHMQACVQLFHHVWENCQGKINGVFSV